MMRTLTFLGCILVVMGLAFWAYRENYRTQASISEMAQVQREIALLRDDLGVLRAEWSYLNRPARLRELVDLNFDRLQLVPLEAGQTVDLGNIDYPAPPPPPAAEGETEEQQP
ncbi:cell division protein FtsL [Paracoccus siganidrum]|nr:cell division protein FtsL [Paracoccus siganidrum]